MRTPVRLASWLIAGAIAVAGCTLTTARPPAPSTAPPHRVTASPPETAAPTPASAPAVAAIPVRGPIAPGTYLVGDPFPVSMELTVDGGWSSNGVFADGLILAHNNFVPPGLVLFGTWLVDRVYSDPCRHVPGPAIGDGVEALVAAFRAVPDASEVTPSSVSLDGHAATRLDLEFAEDLDPARCVNREYALWGFGGDYTRYIPTGYPGKGVDRLWILEVDDTRIVLSGSVSAGTDADLAALDRIVETVRFR